MLTFAFLSSLLRDLTARNILISVKNTAKVSNFELTRDAAYNYVGCKLPIKWTAPEAIYDGVSGSKLEDGRGKDRRRDVDREEKPESMQIDEDAYITELLPTVISYV